MQHTEIDQGLLKAIEIPPHYHATCNAIEDAVRPIAERVDNHAPGGRFGMRAFNHSLKIADEALHYGSEEGFSAEQIGVLMVSLLCEDIGRHIAALPSEERKKYIPAQNLQDQDENGKEKWTDDFRAQHNHGELSRFFLENHPDLLKDLMPLERRIVLDVASNHHTRDLKMERTNQAFPFCQMGRDIDKCDLLVRKEFMTPDGALQQFIEWGEGTSSFSKVKAAEILENQELRSDVGQYLAKALTSTVSRDEIQTQLSKYENSSDKYMLLVGVFSWFETPPDVERNLKPVRDWLNNPTGAPPQFSKEEMISNYPNYMLAQLLMPLQVETQSVLKVLNQQHILDARAEYVRRSLEPAVFNEYLEPLYKRLGLSN